MLKIYNIKEKQEFLREVAELTQKEWGSQTNSKEEFEEKINKKISKIINNFNNCLLYTSSDLFKTKTLLFCLKTFYLYFCFLSIHF